MATTAVNAIVRLAKKIEPALIETGMAVETATAPDIATKQDRNNPATRSYAPIFLGHMSIATLDYIFRSWKEITVTDCAGFSFAFKARQGAHSRSM